MVSRADTRARRYDPTETRQRVLDAASRLFSTRGFVATGTAEIAREAQVSEGSIFYHFGSKRNLLVELGRHYGEQMVAAMQQDTTDLGALGIDTTIRRCFDYCAVNRIREALHGDAEGGKRQHNPEAEPFYHASRETLVAWIERHLAATLARTGRSGINVPVAASLVHAAVSDALDRAFAATTSAAERAAIMAETIRFVQSACDYEAR